MKTRICPKCEYQNSPDAWSCAGCGETLSVSTVVEVDNSFRNDILLENQSVMCEKDIESEFDNTSQSPLPYHDVEISAYRQGIVSEGPGFWIRALARIIDLILHNLLSLIAGVIGGIVIAIVSAISAAPPEAMLQKLETTPFTTYVLIGLGYIVYSSFSEGVHGSTLGKLICGLVVIKKNKEPCTIGPAIIRSLAFLIDSLFFGAVAAFFMASSSKKQRLGDEWAKTIVVKRGKVHSEALRSAWRFTFVFIGAIFFDFALIMTAYFLQVFG